MGLFDRWFGSAPALSPEQRQRLDAYRQLAAPSTSVAAQEASFIVADVETSGLDAFNDRLLAIGAVRVERGRVLLGECFYRVIRQEQPTDKENILVHRIGGTEQRSGEDLAEVLLAFMEFTAKQPMVGYNAAFDATVLGRAGKAALRAGLDAPWLDLAILAPAILDESKHNQPLDHWLERFDLMAGDRHHALADSLATARLLQIVIDAAARKTPMTVADLIEREKSERWLKKAGRV